MPPKKGWKKFCKWGHRYTESNTAIDKNGHRSCRMCRTEAQKRYEARKICLELGGVESAPPLLLNRKNTILNKNQKG